MCAYRLYVFFRSNDFRFITASISIAIDLTPNSHVAITGTPRIMASFMQFEWGVMVAAFDRFVSGEKTIGLPGARTE
jgi:hypothetical protein